MKTAAKILCIIALVIGIIWATVGFFGSWVGGSVISAGQEVFAEDSQGANSTLDSTVNIMLKLIGSFVIVIIGGVLGIIGSDKKPSKLKPLIFGVLTLICGIILFPLHNYVAASLYLIAGLLLVLSGLTTKMQVENEGKENKKLIVTGIIFGIVILLVGGFCLLKDSSAKQEKIENEITIDEQPTQSAEEQFDLGEKYYLDDKNFVEAEIWYRKSAEQGYAPAQYKLGAMYYDGKHIKQDFSEALKWIRKSAEQGNADAQLLLGYMYELGDGVTENLSEAVKWFRKSAEQGDKYAQYSLGKMYEYGDGIAQDYDKSIEWYQKAADQGHKKASDALKQLLGEFYGVEYEE